MPPRDKVSNIILLSKMDQREKSETLWDWNEEKREGDTMKTT